METELKKIKENIIKIKELITGFKEYSIFNNIYEIKIGKNYIFQFYPLNFTDFRRGLDFRMVFTNTNYGTVYSFIVNKKNKINIALDLDKIKNLKVLVSLLEKTIKKIKKEKNKPLKKQRMVM